MAASFCSGRALLALLLAALAATVPACGALLTFSALQHPRTVGSIVLFLLSLLLYQRAEGSCTRLTGVMGPRCLLIVGTHQTLVACEASLLPQIWSCGGIGASERRVGWRSGRAPVRPDVAQRRAPVALLSAHADAVVI